MVAREGDIIQLAIIRTATCDNEKAALSMAFDWVSPAVPLSA